MEDEGERRARRLLPPMGAKAVYAWIDANDRDVSWLARKIAERRDAEGSARLLSRQHLDMVLRREREISEQLARDIAAVTGIDVELLMPVAVQVAS